MDLCSALTHAVPERCSPHVWQKGPGTFGTLALMACATESRHINDQRVAVPSFRFEDVPFSRAQLRRFILVRSLSFGTRRDGGKD